MGYMYVLWEMNFWYVLIVWKYLNLSFKVMLEIGVI